jgi:transglutaminase-like putative cysteine protease
MTASIIGDGTSIAEGRHTLHMVILRIAMLVMATIVIWAPARASTAFLDQATEFVRDEAEALSGTLDASTDAFRYYASLSAMTLVQTRLSSIRYAAMMTKPGFKPPVTPEDALAQGVGLCGDHTAAFEAILDRLGIPSRRVQVFWKPSIGDRYGHIFPEVFWGGR